MFLLLILQRIIRPNHETHRLITASSRCGRFSSFVDARLLCKGQRRGPGGITGREQKWGEKNFVQIKIRSIEINKSCVSNYYVMLVFNCVMISRFSKNLSAEGRGLEPLPRRLAAQETRNTFTAFSILSSKSVHL